MSDYLSLLIPLSPFMMARAVRVPPDMAPERALAALGLAAYRGVIVVHGGAGKMEASQVGVSQRFAVECLAPFARANQLVLVDGGTDVGVMKSLGWARQQVHGGFPLVGVLPYGCALYPGGPPADEKRVRLNSAHTHFIFVEGDEFGAESALMVGLLGAAGVPGLALVINGGEIVLREAQAHAARSHILVTGRGSGRVADELADPSSAARQSLPPETRLHVADITAPAECRALFERLLFSPAGS